MRRRAVAQHLGLPYCNGGDDGEVRSLRAVGDTVAEPGDDRRAMAPLAVDQEQRVIGRQVAQVRRTNDGRRVADRLNVDVEGGDHGPQLLRQLGSALGDEVIGPDDVDRHGRLDGRARLRSAADDDERRGDRAELQDKIPLDRLARHQLHIVQDACLKAGHLRRDRIGPGRQIGELVIPACVRTAWSGLIGCLVGRSDIRAGDDGSGGVGHGSPHGGALLSVPETGPDPEQRHCHNYQPLTHFASVLQFISSQG